MMINIITDRPDGKLGFGGAANVDAVPEIGEILEVERFGNDPIKYEVLETHHTSRRLSPMFSDDAEWAYCRRI